MKLIYSSLTILIVIIFGSSLMAQPLAETKYETMIEVADEAALAHDYSNAIEWYDKAYKESKDKNIKVAIGDLYMLLKDYKRAERSYNIVLRRDRENQFTDLKLDYAEALQYQSKYKEALKELRALVQATENEEIRATAQKRINDIESMEALPENIEIVVSYIDSDINSGSGENSPAFYPDERALYFSSFNRRGTINLDEDDDFYAAIYTAPMDKDGNFGEPLRLDDHINRPGVNTSGVSFSADGRIMYFTRVVLDVNNIQESKIYMSYRKDNDWGAAREIESINGDYLAMHPYEGELYGRKVLFFTSDMEGGKGGKDIYYSEINGDTYGTPVNLGDDINTAADEVTPFYQDGTLYFSSDGYAGKGGLDIYKATWNGQAFEAVENMGDNYNSEVDDTYFRMDAGGKNGYLISNRPDKKKKRFKGSETCCDDIYSMKLEEIIINLLATVSDEDGPLEDATVELYDLTMGDTEPVATKTNLKDNSFNFLLKADHDYRITAIRDGYDSDSLTTFNTIGIFDDYTVKKDIVLVKRPDVVTTDDGEVFETEEVSINQPIRLSNIYYDYDKWDILEEAEEDLGYLKSLMDQYSDMVIELSSHTDSRGVSTYNQKLSQKRAESAKNWLVSRGISPERIKAVGYGEEMILNRCTNGVRCTDDEHRINRRTEFKIIAGPQTITIKKFKTVKSYYKERSIDSQKVKVPVISLKKPLIDLGKMRKGESKEVIFEFENTGEADLVIEVVTACKCTDLEWPKEAVKPGERGVIKATFHTEHQPEGAIDKTVDIFSNTDPIVVEAKFKAFILPPVKKM